MQPRAYLSDQPQVNLSGADIQDQHDGLAGNEIIRRFLIDTAQYLGLPREQIDWID
ncbi:MAG: hypothetical protein R6X06_08665 [Gammaproteobacteria bacterium]